MTKLGVTAAATFMAGALGATPITFDFSLLSASNVASVTQTVGGLTVTATPGTQNGGTFDEIPNYPKISAYSGLGLGVKSGSSSDEHTVDNYNNNEDYVKFSFTNALNNATDVRVTSVTLSCIGCDLGTPGTASYTIPGYYTNENCRRVNHHTVCDQVWHDPVFVPGTPGTGDADISYLVGLLGPGWSTGSVSGLGYNDTYTYTFDGGIGHLPTLGLSNLFRLGAKFGDNNDDFKIMSLTVEENLQGLDCVPGVVVEGCSTVPEPGTLSSLGLAAFAMAAVGRLRRRRAA